jgi:hypothetical protein
MRNVIGYNTAIEKGLEPIDYSFEGINNFFADKEIIEILATLDFKVWSKGAMAVTCFFCDTETKTKFKLNVFRKHYSNDYKLENNDEIDFTECPTSKTYRLEIKLAKNMPKLLSCEMVD